MRPDMSAPGFEGPGEDERMIWQVVAFVAFIAGCFSVTVLLCIGLWVFSPAYRERAEWPRRHGE